MWIGRSVLVVIVLCLILDSRQNLISTFSLGYMIVLCLILDSRQNQNFRLQ